MDTAKRNAEGLAPIKGDLAKIDAIKNLNDLQKYLLEATKLGDNSFYGWRVGADMKNSKMNAVYLGGPDLGLGRDYYQKVNEANTKTLAEYQAYGKLFGVLGYKNSIRLQKCSRFRKTVGKLFIDT
jgi:putative endopeptidase